MEAIVLNLVTISKPDYPSVHAQPTKLLDHCPPNHGDPANLRRVVSTFLLGCHRLLNVFEIIILVLRYDRGMCY